MLTLLLKLLKVLHDWEKFSIICGRYGCIWLGNQSHVPISRYICLHWYPTWYDTFLLLNSICGYRSRHDRHAEVHQKLPLRHHHLGTLSTNYANCTWISDSCRLLFSCGQIQCWASEQPIKLTLVCLVNLLKSWGCIFFTLLLIRVPFLQTKWKWKGSTLP